MFRFEQLADSRLHFSGSCGIFAAHFKLLGRANWDYDEAFIADKFISDHHLCHFDIKCVGTAVNSLQLKHRVGLFFYQTIIDIELKFALLVCIAHIGGDGHITGIITHCSLGLRLNDLDNRLGLTGLAGCSGSLHRLRLRRWMRQWHVAADRQATTRWGPAFPEQGSSPPKMIVRCWRVMKVVGGWLSEQCREYAKNKKLIKHETANS